MHSFISVRYIAPTPPLVPFCSPTSRHLKDTSLAPTMRGVDKYWRPLPPTTLAFPQILIVDQKCLVFACCSNVSGYLPSRALSFHLCQCQFSVSLCACVCRLPLAQTPFSSYFLTINVPCYPYLHTTRRLYDNPAITDRSFRHVLVVINQPLAVGEQPHAEGIEISSEPP